MGECEKIDDYSAYRQIKKYTLLQTAFLCAGCHPPQNINVDDLPGKVNVNRLAFIDGLLPLFKLVGSHADELNSVLKPNKKVRKGTPVTTDGRGSKEYKYKYPDTREIESDDKKAIGKLAQEHGLIVRPIAERVYSKVFSPADKNLEAICFDQDIPYEDYFLARRTVLPVPVNSVVKYRAELFVKEVALSKNTIWSFLRSLNFPKPKFLELSANKTGGRSYDAKLASASRITPIRDFIEGVRLKVIGQTKSLIDAMPSDSPLIRNAEKLFNDINMTNLISQSRNELGPLLLDRRLTMGAKKRLSDRKIKGWILSAMKSRNVQVKRGRPQKTQLK